MEIIFQSHANKTHFHQKGCALGLILKVSVFGIRKSPIQMVIDWFFDYWATFKVQLFERRLTRTSGYILTQVSFSFYQKHSLG